MCLVSIFDRQNPLGSVRNCQFNIANCQTVSWFKCKFKNLKMVILEVVMIEAMNLASWPNVKCTIIQLLEVKCYLSSLDTCLFCNKDARAP